ncbi:MAG: NAD-dependent malic enzyme [Deltaproteobacteria bacterium]|nr:NAD-dependent malic enzyme [Deltaproteobacteria bacterium]
MERFGLKQVGPGQYRLECPYRGLVLLRHAMYSKGSAFSQAERVAFKLEGLLPAHVVTIEQQARRAYQNIGRKTDPLEKYIGLASLQDRNEHLFYRVLGDHIEELMPIVYTPTVGRACQEFSHIFRRSRGLWITPEHRGRIYEVLGGAPFDDVRLIVVTDNERILGLGDQGAGGMGIPVGKLALYTAAAGIPPWQTLPISLDVGTDNQTLLNDDLYLGARMPRLRGPAYDALVEEFVSAVKQRFPRAILQWEDFKKNNAFRLLDRYRKVLPSFNDDIQGTAAVAVAAIAAATRATGVPLAAQRVVLLGAGAAGIGIARLIRATLQRAGVTGEALTAATASIDSRGLLVDDQAIADEHKLPFAWPAALAARCGLGAGQPRDLLSVVRAIKPTVLIGTTGEAGAFSESIIREMARHTERPVILPMSNPTNSSEAMPVDILAWTGGRALVATGSPFEPVEYDGRRITIGQVNNVLIFPGVGLGAILSEVSEVTDSMFVAAADQLATEANDDDLARGSVLPPIRHIRKVTARIAAAVVRAARDAGVARRRIEDDQIEEAIASAMWEPVYLPIDPIAMPTTPPTPQ